MNVIDNFSVSQACGMLSEALHMIILFQTKIEQLKQKLCGFDDFSVETAFRVIDTESKGYLSVGNIKGFLDNNIIPKDIQTLLYIYGNHERLSFLGFLRMIKPNLDKKLAEEIALRGQKRDLKREYKGLLTQILTLSFVMVGELQKLKLSIVRQYCLNPSEMRRLIFGKNMSDNQRTDVKNFINNHGFEISQDDIRYLECYINSKIQLYDDHIMHLLFLPTHFKSNYQQCSKVQEKIIDQLPFTTKTNFLDFKYPGSSGVIPYNISSKHDIDNKDQAANQGQIKVLDNFLLNSQNSYRPNKSFVRQIDNSPRQDNDYEHQFSSRSQHRNWQCQANTPVLDMFLRSSQKQNFYLKKQQTAIQKHIKEESNVTPKKTNRKDNDLIIKNDNNLNCSISPPATNFHQFSGGNVLDIFMKSEKVKQQFQDSVSIESQSAFRYV